MTLPLLHWATIISLSFGILFRGQKNNLATWIMWTFLDVFGYYGTSQIGDDLTLTRTFVIGTIVVAVILLIKWEVAWTWVEWFTAVLVFICFVVTIYGTTMQIIWATAFALSFAGVPWLKDLFLSKQATDYSTKVSAMFFLAGVIFAETSTLVKGQSPIIATSGLIYWTVGGLLVFKQELKEMAF